MRVPTAFPTHETKATPVPGVAATTEALTPREELARALASSSHPDPGDADYLLGKVSLKGRQAVVDLGGDAYWARLTTADGLRAIQRHAEALGATEIRLELPYFDDDNSGWIRKIANLARDAAPLIGEVSIASGPPNEHTLMTVSLDGDGGLAGDGLPAIAVRVHPPPGKDSCRACGTLQVFANPNVIVVAEEHSDYPAENLSVIRRGQREPLVCRDGKEAGKVDPSLVPESAGVQHEVAFTPDQLQQYQTPAQVAQAALEVARPRQGEMPQFESKADSKAAATSAADEPAPTESPAFGQVVRAIQHATLWPREDAVNFARFIDKGIRPCDDGPFMIDLDNQGYRSAIMAMTPQVWAAAFGLAREKGGTEFRLALPRLSNTKNGPFSSGVIARAMDGARQLMVELRRIAISSGPATDGKATIDLMGVPAGAPPITVRASETSIRALEAMAHHGVRVETSNVALASCVVLRPTPDGVAMQAEPMPIARQSPARADSKAATGQPNSQVAGHPVQ